MNRLSDYRFSFKKMLALTGNTAPYMLYAYVRISGIQRRAAAAVAATAASASGSGGGSDIADAAVRSLTADELILGTPQELQLAKQLMRLEEILVEVSQDLCPNKVI